MVAWRSKVTRLAPVTQTVGQTAQQKVGNVEYRILQDGEIIQDGDEVDISQHLNEEPVWVKTTCAGQKAPNPLYPAHRVYRRPTPLAPDTATPSEAGEPS